MRAARYYGNRDIRIEEIPEPELKPGHVMIEPAFVGICGSGFIPIPRQAYCLGY